MKLYGFCSLLLWQVVSLFGASEKRFCAFVEEPKGYVEYQSKISADRNDSFLFDMMFESDCGRVDGETSKIVHACALVSLQTAGEQAKKEVNENLALFFKSIAPQALSCLKKKLEDNSITSCLCSPDVISENNFSLLSHIKSLVYSLKCLGAEGSVLSAYEDDLGSLVKVAFCLRNWYPSVYLAESKPFFMGSVDPSIADEGIMFLQEHTPDLHMLIFHKKSALILQAEGSV